MRSIAVLVVIGLALSLLTSLWPSQAQDSDPLDLQVEQLMQQMSTAEKVGQLFLVTFLGNDVSPDSAIYDLITTIKWAGWSCQRPTVTSSMTAIRRWMWPY